MKLWRLVKIKIKVKITEGRTGPQIIVMAMRWMDEGDNSGALKLSHLQANVMASVTWKLGQGHWMSNSTVSYTWDEKNEGPSQGVLKLSPLQASAPPAHLWWSRYPTALMAEG